MSEVPLYTFEGGTGLEAHIRDLISETDNFRFTPINF